jgi:hypothetical protein
LGARFLFILDRKGAHFFIPVDVKEEQEVALI